MALTTLKSLDAEIKQLEAQKKLVEKRDSEVPKALAVLQMYAKVLTPAQRRQMAKLIGQAVKVEGAGPDKTAKAASKVRKLGKVAPKFRLPDGTTWTGRGLTPKVFVAWLKSAEGKDWSAANPGERFPGAVGKKAATKALKKVGKVARKVKTVPVRKATKKAAKKAVRKQG